MGNIAPYQFNLTVNCGADYVMTVPFTAVDGVTAVNLSAPEMDIRVQASSAAALVVTPALSVSGNTVTITISGAVSDAITADGGQYDLFATRVDTGARVKLLYGTVSFIQNTTAIV
jgi:hypothetical protein